MFLILLALVITYLITSLFGYVVHWMLHQSWAGKANVSHMTHHLKLYPPEDYSSEEYRNAGKDSTHLFFSVVSLPLIIFPIILWIFGVISLTIFVTIFLTEVIVGWASNYFHDSFHISNHFLSSNKYFIKLTELHYLHHVDMKTNYGIFSFHWDKLFKTFSE